MLRQREHAETGKASEIYHYAGDSDSPAWIQSGSMWTRNIAGISGELIAIADDEDSVTFQLSNLHGDIVATASADLESNGLLGTFEYDEFGNPNGEASARYGWLGAKGRRTELPSGVVQMGVRTYVPRLGRFTTPDPVLGGSANAYDYANADPVNGLDLDGMRAKRRSGVAVGVARAVPSRRYAISLPLPVAIVPSPAPTIAEAVRKVWEKIKPRVGELVVGIAARFGVDAGAVYERAVRFALNAAQGGARTLDSLKGWIKREFQTHLPELLACGSYAWTYFMRAPPHPATKASAAAAGCREGWISMTRKS